MLEFIHSGKTFQFDCDGNLYQESCSTSIELDSVRFEAAGLYLGDQDLKRALSSAQRKHMVAIRELTKHEGMVTP